ncbi:hypothetical protein B296_00023218 [Ensete ventricosum]|uniref:Uncharacterized protein n=1 Tax=Ensete ventricosum TaxID=4639 RepID=A0A426ZST7_ENSVE|nr:hypothetical protein B296_00023218 [Ensete ventricosum]
MDRREKRTSQRGDDESMERRLSCGKDLGRRRTEEPRTTSTKPHKESSKSTRKNPTDGSCARRRHLCPQPSPVRVAATAIAGGRHFYARQPLPLLASGRRLCTVVARAWTLPEYGLCPQATVVVESRPAARARPSLCNGATAVGLLFTRSHCLQLLPTRGRRW